MKYWLLIRVDRNDILLEIGKPSRIFMGEVAIFRTKITAGPPAQPEITRLGRISELGFCLSRFRVRIIPSTNRILSLSRVSVREAEMVRVV